MRRGPCKTSDFFDEVFMKTAPHEEGYYKKNILKHFVCKGLSNDDVMVARGTVFQEREIRPGAGFETGDFFRQRKVEGAVLP